MTHPADVALVAACSRALGCLELATAQELLDATELLDELKAALELTRQHDQAARTGEEVRP